MAPAPTQRSASDLVDDLMRSLRRQIAAAADVAQSSRNAAGLVFDLVTVRRQLAQVRDLLHSQAQAHRDAVMSTVWSLYRKHPEALAVSSRSGVVRAWTHLLIDATEKVEHDEHWARRYEEAQPPDEEALVAAASRSSSSALRDL